MSELKFFGKPTDRFGMKTYKSPKAAARAWIDSTRGWAYGPHAGGWVYDRGKPFAHGLADFANWLIKEGLITNRAGKWHIVAEEKGNGNEKGNE